MVRDFVRVVGAVGLCNMKPRLLLARCIHIARDSSRDDAFPIQVMLAALLHAAFQKKINCCIAPILTLLCGCAKQRARDITPLYPPSLHLNLTYPHLSSLGFLCTLYRLTSIHPSRLGGLIHDREAAESVNSWRERFKGARTGSRGP
jgi:hypothetical protein